MKKIIVLIVAMLAIASVAAAASPQDVKKVLRAVNHKSEKLLSFKEYPEHDGSFQSVYVENGKRYTVYYGGEKYKHFSFWVRPEGSSGQNAVKTFTDASLNGKVEFGIQGYPNQKMFNVMDGRGEGHQYQKYWQKLYDAAIADALNHFQN